MAVCATSSRCALQQRVAVQLCEAVGMLTLTLLQQNTTSAQDLPGGQAEAWRDYKKKVVLLFALTSAHQQDELQAMVGVPSWPTASVHM